MTPKSLLIRLNDLIIRWLCKCVWSWIYFSGAICTVVCPHCENDNEWKQTPCSFIVYEPKIKEIYSFLWWNLSKFHVLQSVNYILITFFFCDDDDDDDEEEEVDSDDMEYTEDAIDNNSL